MGKIKSVHAREILDSRGNPTLCVTILTNDGNGTACVPSGASTGSHEAVESRDGGKRYGGLGVACAVRNVNKKIAKALTGKESSEIFELDAIMKNLDGTTDKRRLGANAILGVSMACCRAGGDAWKTIIDLSGNKTPLLPIPCANVINGGLHAGNRLNFQEYMIIPVGARNFSSATQMVSETYHTLRKLLIQKYDKMAVNVGDEGGFAPPMKHCREPLDILLKAIDEAGYSGKIKLGLDCAASSFFSHGAYDFEGRQRHAGYMHDLFVDLAKSYPIISIEDPFFEEDFAYFSEMTKHLSGRVQIVGDDLLTTNPERIQRAIVYRACNALLLKVNQIGTVSESVAAWELANGARWKTMVSHRSGETTDTFICDMAVGLGCGQIKLGAPCRGERVVKYNELLRMEEENGFKIAKWG